MRLLQARWPGIRHRIHKARHVLLCCDFDGTLAPIADHPSHVRLPTRTHALLRRLANHSRLSLVFISGRRLADLKRLVKIRRACYAGNHGLELEERGVRHVDPTARAFRRALRQIATHLNAALRGVPGVWVEDKGLTLSLHVRQATAADRARAQRILATIVKLYEQKRQVRVMAGKMVWEIRPAVPWDKGAAVRWLARRYTDRRSLVICLVDDQTDEDAFRATERLRGLSVRVGRPGKETAARYFVRGPREVQAWLQQVYEALRARP